MDEDPRRTAFEHRVVVIHTDADVTPNREPVTIHTRWLIGSALRRAGYEPFELPVTRRSDLDELATTHRGSMIFNLCYGFEAADGSLDQAEVAETLERRGLALVGSGGAAQHTCQDKLATAAVAGQLGIASPRTLSPEEATHATGPLVVKPRRGAAHREVRLATAATVARNPPGPEMIVQEYVDGPEYSIAVVDTGLGAPTVLPSMRIRYGRTRDRPALYDWATTTFAADSSSRFGLDELALALFEALGLRGYARFDFRVTRGPTPVLLDANALPSLAPRQLLATSARWAGILYPALIGRLVSGAVFPRDRSCHELRTSASSEG